MQRETSPRPSATTSGSSSGTAPDWFAPHGEGYCPVCKFIIPRQPGGALEPHERGKAVVTYPGMVKWCPGGGRAPKQARAPFFSRLARFSLRGHQAECPSCRRTVPVARLQEANDRYCYRRHQGGYGACVSSFERVPDGVQITRR